MLFLSKTNLWTCLTDRKWLNSHNERTTEKSGSRRQNIHLIICHQIVSKKIRYKLTDWQRHTCSVRNKSLQLHKYIGIRLKTAVRKCVKIIILSFWHTFFIVSSVRLPHMGVICSVASIRIKGTKQKDFCIENLNFLSERLFDACGRLQEKCPYLWKYIFGYTYPELA